MQQGLAFERHVALPATYQGHRVDCGYRVDFVVERQISLEIESIQRFEPAHTAQIRSYLRLARLRVGLLINFNVKWLRAGSLKRVVNGYPPGGSDPLVGGPLPAG